MPVTTEIVYEEKNHFEDGVIYPFQSHIQENVNSGVIVNAHFHTDIEILFCLSGCADIFLNGRSYDLSIGDMIIIDSKEVHSIIAKPSTSQTEYIVVKFDPEVLYTTSKTIFEAKYVLPFTLSQSTHQKLFTREEISGTFIPSLLNEIYLEYIQKKYGFELAIRTNICRLFLWILRGWNDKGFDLNIDFALNEKNIERLKKVFDYVETNYQFDISIAQMADLCNVSYSYFSRFFKGIMRKNFSEYLNYVRITAAERLLASTDLTITEIALKVGYSTTSYFIRQFKLYKNISPKQFQSYVSHPT